MPSINFTCGGNQERKVTVGRRRTLRNDFELYPVVADELFFAGTVLAGT